MYILGVNRFVALYKLFRDSRQHPVQSFTLEQQARARGLCLHGDEGQGKRERSVMLLSWSILGVRSPNVLHYKFPYAASWPVIISHVFVICRQCRIYVSFHR